MKQQRYGNSNGTYAPASLMEAHGSHGENKSYGDREDFIPWDNPDNIISFQVEDLARRLKDVLFLPILFLIGGPANVINMAVFYKQGLKERINVCLFALSLADGLYLANNMLWYGEQLRLQFTTKEM